MDVMDRDGLDFVEKLYHISDSIPHITLIINKGAIAKDLGLMMKQAKISKWN